MKILILNWRDIKNPSGGGAEILTHEMAQRWVDAGHTVVQFSSAFPNSKNTESIDGVTFIRQGKWWTVHIMAFFYYLKHKNDYEVIIDEVHWFPFFAAIYARSKTVALTCEVATSLLFRIMPFPLAVFFAAIEKIYLILYKNVPMMVISESTKNDLLTHGHKKNNIVVIPMGLTLPKKIKHFSKEKNFTLVSVGRLNAQKGIVELIEAFTLIKKAIPECSLWLVGSGERSFVDKIHKHIEELGLTSSITFFGFVDEEKKFNLLSRAHILISASMQEGWGLTIPEAGMVRTPSVVYNIAGFRDIIIQQRTGILMDTNPKALASETIRLLQNKTKYETMQEDAFKHAKQYSWENTAAIALNFLEKIHKL